MSEPVEISCQIVRETQSAYLIDAGLKEDVWIPRSQVSEITEPDKKGLVEVSMPEWLAKEKDLI